MVEATGVDPILFDLGTGLQYFGSEHGGCRPIRGHAFVTHLHWDHIQGLPFFDPLHHPDSLVDIYGPTHDGVSFADSFSRFMNPPLFPIHYSQLIGDVRFFDFDHGVVDLGRATVTAAPVPHVGATNGYRVDSAGKSVVYVSDHQQPADRTVVDEAVLSLAEGADILIHDAQYTPEQFPSRYDWGHCTARYAFEVAKQAGVKTLVLFHHDPSHDDEALDSQLVEARTWSCGASEMTVVSAFEGLRLTVPG